MHMKEILFYETLNGREPVAEFIDNLTAKEAQKVVWVLKLIQKIPNVPTKYFKKLINTDNIWEVRIVSGSNSYRILGFFENNDLIILNHAFQKKTQKTPRQAIATAEKRKKEYLEREQR